MAVIFVGRKIPTPSLAAMRVPTGVSIISCAMDPKNTSCIVLSFCCSLGATRSVAIIGRLYLGPPVVPEHEGNENSERATVV